MKIGIIICNMKIGMRGQVTIPKALRERFGLVPETEVDFVEKRGELVLKKQPKSGSRNPHKWIGCLQGCPEDVDGFIEAIRGR